MSADAERNFAVDAFVTAITLLARSNNEHLDLRYIEETVPYLVRAINMLPCEAINEMHGVFWTCLGYVGSAIDVPRAKFSLFGTHVFQGADNASKASGQRLLGQFMAHLKPGMDTCQVIARFDAERQALALMDHPNIALAEHFRGPAAKPFP